MQSNFCHHHFGLEWKKRKIVRRVHAKRILQTVPHTRVGTTRVSDSTRVGLESHFLVTRTRLESLLFFSEMTRVESLF